jgi:CheY-like chemotaxis protein
MKALIADDDAITRLLLSNALTKLGHEVQEAANGAEAWEAWRAGEFPLIISDWMMPDLDGLEFCRRIRAEQRAQYTCVLLLTSRSGKTNFLEAMAAGVDDFITKPFDKDAFAARIQVAERIVRLHAKLRDANADLERRVQERTAELASALQAKSELLSRTSHELRTPMNHVLGFAQLLEMDPLTAEQSESVQQILESGGRLLRLIDRILAVEDCSSSDLSFLATDETEESPLAQSQIY